MNTFNVTSHFFRYFNFKNEDEIFCCLKHAGNDYFNNFRHKIKMIKENKKIKHIIFIIIHILYTELLGRNGF
jgi:hypothetical protein